MVSHSATPTSTTPYLLLEIDESATSSEIRKAYYKASLKYHPDKTNGDESAASQFRLCRAAYAVLSDRVLRMAYHTSTDSKAYKQFVVACEAEGTYVQWQQMGLPSGCEPTAEEPAAYRAEEKREEQDEKRTAAWAAKEQERMDRAEEREAAGKAKEEAAKQQGAHKKTQEEKNAAQRAQMKQTQGRYAPRVKARCVQNGRCGVCGKEHTNKMSGSAKKKAKKAKAAAA